MRTSIISEFRAGILHLVASRQADTILVSAILNGHPFHRRPEPLDLGCQTSGSSAVHISRRMQREAGGGTYELAS